ncbi:MAG TPA: cellulase family glycosylhydrolase [Pseudonocardiaceae bacterium]|jgi:endoglucanase|nr:cellulase family glycosylhydrolase [Pseudonocardiaceae bacterium]
MGTMSGKVAAAIASLGAVAAVVTGTMVTAPNGAVAHAAAAPAVGAGFWHTNGNQILDAAGNPVRIAGVNWYGFETPDQVAHGLWAQDYHTILSDIHNLGYNTIRVPFSNQMVETPVVPQNLSFFNNTGAINTDLKGLTSLGILDKIVTAAGQDGLKIILDDHRSEAGESAEQNGLWYTSAFPNSAWLNDWKTMATRYAGNSTVIGFDLRNEPHTPAGVAYAQGATWGTGDPNTDVRLAYQNAGNAILAVDSQALIFTEGISLNPNSSGGFDSTWWGGNLVEAGQFPVTLSSPGHVVYSAHDYGPVLFQQAWFNSSTTQASLFNVWHNNWGYLYFQGLPLWVGEFGTGNGATDVSDSTPGSQGQWFSSLVAYIKAAPAMGWTYWAANGEDSFALLDNGYDATPVSAAKQQLLAGIQSPLSGTGGTTTTGAPPTTTTAAPPPPTTCSVAYTVTNSWSGGFQASVTITNTGTSAINGWTLQWTFGGGEKISNMWNATETQTGAQVSAVNAGFDATIAPSSSVNLGFTANSPTASTAPTAFTVNGASCH